jgi:broad specificity phosphatase PhoE
VTRITETEQEAPACGKFTRRGALAFMLALGLLPVLRPVAAAQEPPADLLEKLRYPKTVLVVRHAEKATDDPLDPALSEAGEERAVALARLLEDADVSHLYATEFRRTQDTLAPLSVVSGAAVQMVPARDPRALVSAISNLPRGSVVVVAGHSNTVPALVKLLVPERDAFELAESDYDRLYAITLTGDKGPATVLSLRYGAE